MNKSPCLFALAGGLMLAALSPLCSAVETRVWQQNDFEDFTKGTTRNLSIRSDGHLTLAPQFRELLDSGLPYLWAVTQDTKGTLYCAGGAPTGSKTKIFAIDTKGKSRVFAEMDALEIHALAVDRQNRLYAAVAPDAKIYRFDAAGKPELFFDPKAKYIWSMVFDRQGNLFVATGDKGIVFKVTPDGKGSEFFDTEESHARSMVIDNEENLIVGTEPSGLVLRVSPKGEGFVLYQTDRREVTAVALRGSHIYAASVGGKPTPGRLQPMPVPPAPTASPGSSSGITQAAVIPQQASPTAPPSFSAQGSTGVPGGSEFYRIDSSGFAQKVWSSGQDIVYAIGFDAEGKPLLGTGNKGLVYRVDSDTISTQLTDAPPTQITAFFQDAKGALYAVTGNVGKLYQIGQSLESSGSIESEILDAGSFTYWGRIHLKSNLRGGAVTVETRSGNLNRPQRNWSAWSKVPVNEQGGEIASPSARFLQYRVTLAPSPKGESPDVSSIELAYQARNIAPRVEQIEIEPANYRFPAPPAAPVDQPNSPRSLNLPPIGSKRDAAAPPAFDGTASNLQYGKGAQAARWNAVDDNGDELAYKVEIKGQGEQNWHLLRDNVREKYLTWDSIAFPDGKYVLRIEANDVPGNPPDQALKASLESDPFVIDNTPPEITWSTAAVKGAVEFTAKDALNWIGKAEYSIDGGDWVPLEPKNRVTDSQSLEYRVEIPASVPTGAGHVLAVRVYDENDNLAVKSMPIR